MGISSGSNSQNDWDNLQLLADLDDGVRSSAREPDGITQSAPTAPIQKTQ